MYRSNTCGELRASHTGSQVTLSGWVHRLRDKGFVIWVDLRDRYGITQLVFDQERSPKDLLDRARDLGRETVTHVTGAGIERDIKNPNLLTCDQHIRVQAF